MGIVRDVTVDQLTQAVNNIDTSTLAQDSTLQDVVTAISNISGGSDPVTNTTVNTLGKDTTLQSIAAAINSLSGAISPAASNVTFDNTTSGLTASNAQSAIEEVNEKANTALQISNGSTTSPWGTTVSITRIAQFKSMLIIGGRLNKGFIVLIPSGTNEYVILSNINSCITSVSVSSSTIDIVLSSNGYGSNIIINTIVLI